jgi:hypothetical protein
MQNKFEWRGIDGGGFHYGFCRQGDAISIRRRQNSPAA